MIVLRIALTHKSPHPKARWTRFYSYNTGFDTLAEAKAYLTEQYFSCKKRVPCYHDTPTGQPMQTGWIYCFKERKDGKTRYRQDWVSFYDQTFTPIDVNKCIACPRCAVTPVVPLDLYREGNFDFTAQCGIFQCVDCRGVFYPMECAEEMECPYCLNLIERVTFERTTASPVMGDDDYVCLGCRLIFTEGAGL